ncbi:MAG: HAD family hydrolase [Candidatus Faecousia sp.]|nr:HAD family hydrolase [Bacillota bacterium]MDY4219273.1 HAD family hydrolase [Candidatus Faecousia sp.]
MCYETIYFDLDGTLTDSGPGIMNAVAYALGAMGRPVPSRASMRRFIGPPLSYSFQAYEGMSPEDAHRAVELYRVYYNDRGKFENTPYPGIDRLLEALRAKGKRLYVATSKPEGLSVEILEHFGLAGYFERIAGSTLDDSRSTKIQVLRYAIGMGGRERAVMVGDRHLDVEGARENGLPCVGVVYGYGSRQELQEAGALALADTVEDLLHILED